MKELIFIRTEQKSASFSQGRAFPERGHKGDKRAIRRDENQRHQAEDHQEEAEEVSTDLQTYPEYKDSGLPWLGSIPRHWDCLPHRAIFEEIKEQGHVNEPLLSVTIGRGILRQEDLLAESSKKDSSNLDKSKYKFVEPGDIAYNKMRAWQGAVGVSKYRGIVSPAYIVQRLRGQLRPDYFHYLFRTPGFAKEAERWSYGITSDQWSLRPQHFKMIYSCIPPLDEQELIVGFLRDFDRQVRRFIRNRRRLIKVLNEQKQAIINRAMTRGLDPNAALKPSGIDWIGDIPEHWEVRRIKMVTKILRGKFSHRPRNDPSLYDGKFPFIQTGDVARAEKFIIGYKQTLNEKGFAVSKEFPKGTLTMTIAANIGDVAILDFDACFPDSIVGFIPDRGVFLDFLFYSFTAMKRELLKEAPINTQGNLNIERIGAMSITLPDYEMQKAIAEAIELDTVEIDKAIIHAKQEINLIREYRTRLISDVVTGKVDVRHLAPQPGGEDLEEMVEALEPLGDEPGETDEESMDGEVEP
jgi:type I restriction enzyme S subunit